MALDKDDILRKVQALLNKADASGFTAEADACRKKADDLMLSYSISMWEIDQARKPEQRATAEIRRFDTSMSDSHVKDELRTLFSTLCHHLEVRPVFYDYNWNPGYPVQLYAKVVGFPQELDYLELMFTSMRVQIATHISPQPDKSLSFDENLVLLKEAGVKWERIHELLLPDVPWERKHGVRYTKIYTDYCKNNNRERMYTSPTVYQRNFVQGFSTKIHNRLYDIRATRTQHETKGNGMELMLRDKKAQINDLYESTFKGLTKSKLKKTKFDEAAFSRGVSAGANADLGQQRVSARKEIQ